MATKKPALKRFAYWASAHKLPLVIALVIAAVGIAAVSSFASAGFGPGGSGHPGSTSGGSGSSSSSSSSKGSNEGARSKIPPGAYESLNKTGNCNNDAKCIGDEYEANGNSTTTPSKRAKQQAAARKAAERAYRTAQKNERKQQQKVRESEKRITSLKKQVDKLNCGDGIEECAKKTKLALDIKAREDKLRGQRNTLLHAKYQTSAAKKKLDKLNGHKNKDKKKDKDNNSGGSGGSSGGGSGGGSGSGSGGGKSDGKANDKKAAPGSIQVTVLQQTVENTTAKFPAVRVTVKPKCKAGFKQTAGGAKETAGVATFPGCKPGKHTVSVKIPEGYKVADGTASQSVTVKSKKQQKVKFALAKIEATPTPSASPSPSPSSSPATEDNSDQGTNTENQNQSETTSGTGTSGGGAESAGSTGEVKGTLPETGQAALSALIAVLVLSGAYYGFRTYRRRKESK